MFILALMLTIALSGSTGQDGKKYFKAGTEFMASMKYEEAIVQFSSAIELEPLNSDYYTARAMAYEKTGRLKEAYSDYDKTLFFKPGDVDGYINLGRVCNGLGKYDEALSLLNRASARETWNKQVYPEKVIALMGLEKWDQALGVSDSAVKVKDDARTFYLRGMIYVNLNNDPLAERELDKAVSKDKKFPEPRFELARLYLRQGNPGEAMKQVNKVLGYDDKNTEAYICRSEIYKAQLDISNTINDVSKAILLDPLNPSHFLTRGKYYQAFNQHPSAIADFSKYISLSPDEPEGYFARAKSYEEIGELPKAINDYNKITILSEFNSEAMKLLKESEDRLYILNKENIAPEIKVSNPYVSSDNVMEIRGDAKTITLSGKIKEKSKIEELLVNNQKVAFSDKVDGEYDFIASVNVRDTGSITILARDEYKNEKSLKLNLRKTEVNPPRITILSPTTSREGIVYLNRLSPRIDITGKIDDENLIRNIEAEGKVASWTKDEKNPTFTIADFPIEDLKAFSIIAEDIYGNMDTINYYIDRTNALLLQSNPMGVTYVVFIENSGYENFPSLDGPVQDANTIKRALDNYQINFFWHLKDMTLKDMKHFFEVELPERLTANNVNSLMIWYAGHGKTINNKGYWIPVNAERDKQYTYYDISELRLKMEEYRGLTHTLVVTDACESGPSFYQAMRSVGPEPRCEDLTKIAKKSAQVLTSAALEGNRNASDRSQFSETFANTLNGSYKKRSCVPIETLVNDISRAVTSVNPNQRPRFGNITNLVDEGGTFFFIAK